MRDDRGEPAGNIRRVGAGGEVENGSLRRKGFKFHSLSNSKADRLGQLELTTLRLRHVATRLKDPLIESPAIHER